VSLKSEQKERERDLQRNKKRHSWKDVNFLHGRVGNILNRTYLPSMVPISSCDSLVVVVVVVVVVVNYY